MPEEMVPTVVLLPQVSSVLRFQECSALPGHFLHFSPMYFKLPFPSLSFSFSNLHNLYKYYSMFMFFMDFTGIISSSSPLTFFVACVRLLVYVVSCVRVLVGVRGQSSLSVFSCFPSLSDRISLA